MNRPLIFNLTRLISRQQQRHATGVDRLDINHASLMLELSSTYPVFFVSQVRNTLTLIQFEQAKVLITRLYQRWATQRYQTASRSQLAKTSIAVIKLREFCKNPLCRKLEKSLKNNLPPVYINSGHAGLQHIKIHQYLKDNWHADIIVYLHDLIPIDYPEYSASPKRLHHQLIETIASTATLVLTNSEHTKNRFTNYCKQKNYTQPSTKVIHIGVEQHIIDAAQNSSATTKKLSQNQPYFIAIGTLEPRKNYALLLHIWREISQNQPNQCPQLLILGKRGWKIQNTIDLLEDCSSIQNYVTELNDASDHDLISYLKHAQALLFPSFEEGWGIPVTEALTLGTPVICSDIPALREASQGLATYIHPLDADTWKKEIQKEKTKNKIKKFTPKTWQSHQKKLTQIIKELQAGGKCSRHENSYLGESSVKRKLESYGFLS